jgi:hypothetical protein
MPAATHVTVHGHGAADILDPAGAQTVTRPARPTVVRSMRSVSIPVLMTYCFNGGEM